MMKKLTVLIAFYLFFCLTSASEAKLIGPYSGTVIDSQTWEPIEGASVLIYWEKFVPNPAGGISKMIDVKLIYTDKQGRYQMPMFMANLGLIGFFEATHIIIYQPGYQAYIKRITHNSPYSKPDPSFKEKDNGVKLDRIPPNFSHKKHYEDIDHALWGVDEYPYVYPQPQDKWMTWNKLIEMNLRGIPEKEEFLRRVEWEERRGMMEDRK